MNPKLRRPLIVIGLVTIVAIAIFVVPRGLSLYYQIRGGQRIEYVLRFEEGLDALDCEPLQPDGEGSRTEVEYGKADLERSISLNKNNSQAYYYLGKAHCLLGNADNAVEDYLRYTELRPANPLGQIGLGFAYDKVGDPNHAKISWESAKLMPKDFSVVGDEAFMREQYDQATNWYSRASLLEGEQSRSSRFKWGVASILTGKTFPFQNDGGDLQIYSLLEDFKINGGDLHWMREVDRYNSERYGMNLFEYPTGDPKVGGMWWEGAAITFIKASCTAEFVVQARARHVLGTGQDGRLQFEDDLRPFATFSLMEDWQNYEAEIFLSKGNHILGVRYLEDVGDAMIEWLRISQISDCED